MSRKTFQRLSLDARRRSLLEATLDCIVEYGLDGASARRIADKAGVTAGLIRHYFGSKDDMVLAAYSYLIGELTSSAAESAAVGDDSPDQRLARFIIANVTAPNLSSHKVSLWATFIGRVRAISGYAEIHRESYREFLALLETLIHPVVVASGSSATPAVCREHAIALNGLIDGLWLEGSLGHGLYSAETLPQIALRAAERVLELSAGSLARYAGDGESDTGDNGR